MDQLPKSQNNILVVLLILVSLFAGYQYSKAQNISTNPTTVQAAANNQPATAPAANEPTIKEPPAVTDKDWIRGSKDAKVVLVEYSDFECPFCKRFHPVMEQVMKEYGDKVAWVYRHYPLPFHPKAQKTAEAAECAGELGGNESFWKMADTLVEKLPELELSQLPSVAAEIGLDEAAFKTCLDSGKMAANVKTDLDGGSASGVTGTPGTIILVKGKSPVLIPGALPFESVKPMIDTALK